MTHRAKLLALGVFGLGAIDVDRYSESLSPEHSDGATSLDMMRTNTERIAEALTR